LKRKKKDIKGENTNTKEIVWLIERDIHRRMREMEDIMENGNKGKNFIQNGFFCEKKTHTHKKEECQYV
jgi:hypothetical protein